MNDLELISSNPHRFGDVIFIRNKKSGQSIGLRILDRFYLAYRNTLPTLKSLFNSNLSLRTKIRLFITSRTSPYSHVAFVLDMNTLIHADAKNGVDLVYFDDFFSNPKNEFQILRSLNEKSIAREKSTYFLGQEYDKNFLKRLLGKPKESSQICSTLVADMLAKFNYIDIRDDSLITPSILRIALIERTDLTKDYVKSISKTNTIY